MTPREFDVLGCLSFLGTWMTFASLPSPWVVLPGFEPGMTEPKPVVLPLHHSTILYAFCVRGVREIKTRKPRFEKQVMKAAIGNFKS